MIRLYAEFKGRRYVVEDGFSSSFAAEKTIFHWRASWPEARFVIEAGEIAAADGDGRDFIADYASAERQAPSQ